MSYVPLLKNYLADRCRSS